MSVDWDEIRRSWLRRDPALLHAGLTRWLRARHADATRLEVAPITRASAGQSGETLLVDVTWSDMRGEHGQALAVRLPPPGDGLFPAYDLERLVSMQNLLRAGGIPVPRFAHVETE